MTTATTTETKTCTKCGAEKPVTEFHWKSKKEGRRRSECKECACKKAKEYADAHREQCRESNRRWAAAHRKERNAYARAYHKKHKEKHNAKAKEYYERHHDEICATKAQYYEQNRIEIRKKQNRRYRKSRLYKNLTHEQQLKLFEDNKGLVYHMAKRYSCPPDLYGDMIQAGCEGLWNGICELNKYNPLKSALSTWFCWYIGYQLSHFTYKASLKSGLSASRPTIIKALKNKEQGIESDIENNLLSYRASLDEPLKNSRKGEESGSLIERTGSPDEHYDGLSDEVGKLLSRLEPRKRELLMKYYGVGYNPRTQSELGSELGVSGARIGQLLEEALEELRDMPGVSALAVYLS